MAEFTDWDDVDYPPQDSNGVYFRPRQDFSYLVAGGVRIPWRNPGNWWSHNISELRDQAIRLANALCLPVYELRSDFRRSAPYRWEKITAEVVKRG